MNNTASNTLTLLEERRESKRITFYRGEFPDAVIEFGHKTYKADVYDLSTNGIGVLPREEIQGLDTPGTRVTIQFGTSKKIEATLQKATQVKFSGSLRIKLGFQLSGEHFDPAKNLEKFECQSSMPMAYCDDPVAFNRTMVFNVTYFTSATMGLVTKDEDSGLYVGFCLDLKLMMPVRGEFALIGEVVSIVRRNDSVLVHCVLVNASGQLQNAISEFLLMTTKGLTVKKLRTSGFKVNAIEKAYLFRYANTPAQMDAILRLRLKAAQKEGRWVGETDHEKLRDNWDRHARQIICEVNGEIVCAARIVYNSGLKERSEHVSYNVDIPQWLWEAGFVEASRVCTDPDFRGSDMFFLTIQHLSKIVTQSGYGYLLLNCEDSLVPVYKKTVGVFDLKQRFHTAFMKEKALNLLYCDARWLQLGMNFSPSSWILNVPVGMYLLSTGKLELKWWEKPLLPIFNLAYKLVSSFYTLSRKK